MKNEWQKIENIDANVSGEIVELAFLFSNGNRCYEHCIYDDIEDCWYSHVDGEIVLITHVTHWRYTCAPDEVAK